MPTPFYHLYVARQVLARPDLSARAAALLGSQTSAFYFGGTAPDVQTISGQARQETHFFDLPVRPGDTPPWERMQCKFPTLNPLGALPADQAAFLVGYTSHLLADWTWVNDLYAPVFGPDCRWANAWERNYLHNALRAYLDFQILPLLRGQPQGELRMAELRPKGWLPFVAGKYLSVWRDELVAQLKPGAPVHTVEVFAARQGIPPETYYRLLNSEARMEQEVFSRLPRRSLSEYLRRLVDLTVRLINRVLADQPSAPLPGQNGWLQPACQEHVL